MEQQKNKIIQYKDNIKLEHSRVFNINNYLYTRACVFKYIYLYIHTHILMHSYIIYTPTTYFSIKQEISVHFQIGSLPIFILFAIHLFILSSGCCTHTLILILTYSIYVGQFYVIVYV